MPRYRTISCRHCGFMQLKRDTFCDNCGLMTQVAKVKFIAKGVQIAIIITAFAWMYSHFQNLGVA